MQANTADLANFARDGMTASNQEKIVLRRPPAEDQKGI